MLLMNKMGDNQEQEGAFTNLPVADNSGYFFLIQMAQKNFQGFTQGKKVVFYQLVLCRWRGRPPGKHGGSPIIPHVSISNR